MLDAAQAFLFAMLAHPDWVLALILGTAGYYVGSGRLAREIARDRLADLQRQIDESYEAEVQRRVQEAANAIEEHAKGYDRWVLAVAIGFLKVLSSASPSEIEEWRREAERVVARRQTPLRLLAQLAIRSGHAVDCPYRVEGTRC